MAPQQAELLRERRVAPSILSADFARLGSQVKEVLDAGARVIHVDVMDGHFVPPITFGAVVVSALADLVHDAAGILEATPHIHYTLDEIRRGGCTAGAAICPATPIDTLAEVARETLDLALCMSVNPGWGAQSFIPNSLSKLERMRHALPGHVGLEVDGGVNDQTAGPVVQAGANLLVTGSAVFGSDDPAEAYARIVAAAGAV